MQMNARHFSKAQLMSIFLAMRHSFEEFFEKDDSGFLAGKLSQKRKIISELAKSCFPLLVSNGLLRELADEKEARFIQSLSDQLDDYVWYFNVKYDWQVDQIEKALADLIQSGIADDLSARLQVALSVALGEFAFHYRHDGPKSLTEGNPSYLDKERSKKVREIMDWITGTKWKWPKFIFGWQDAPLLPTDEIREKLDEKFRMYVERKYGFHFQKTKS